MSKRLRHRQADQNRYIQPTNLRLARLSIEDVNLLSSWRLSRVVMSFVLASDRRPINFLCPRFPTNFRPLVALCATSLKLLTAAASSDDFLPMNLRRGPRLLVVTSPTPLSPSSSPMQLPSGSWRQALVNSTPRLPMNLGRLMWSPVLNLSMSTDDSERAAGGLYTQLSDARRTLGCSTAATKSDATKTG